MPRTILWALFITAAATSACGENKRDILQRGLEIEGAAEKGPCRLHYAENAQAATLSGDDVAECLSETERALLEYDKAAQTSLAKDPEFIQIYDRAKGRRTRLQGMLKMVREMETTQLVEGR